MNRPLFMAILKEGDTSSVMLCGRHFAEVMDSILSYLEVPSWLVNADQIRLDGDSVVFELEPGGEGRAMALCADGGPRDPRRVPHPPSP
jgi:hypothetical protein